MKVEATINHADIEINSIKTAPKDRPHAIRQERVEVKNIDCVVAIQGHSYDVLNYSPFGIATISDDPLPNELNFDDVTFVLEGVEVGTLKLRKLREERPWLKGIRTAFEIVGEPLNMSRVKAVQTASDLIARQGVIEHKEALIPDKIRAGILGLKEGLERLEHEINEIQRNIIFLSNNEQYSFEDSFVAVMSNDIHSRIQVSLDQMEVEFDSLDESMKKSIYEYFRHRMAELLYQSPFSKRSVEKPLGYAGDFEMMNILYREENLGDSLFAKCLHRCYLNFKNAQAVRNRVDYFHKAILSTIEKSPSDRPVRILSVACGPAEEIQRLLLDRAIPWERVEIHLLDQDLGALRNAQAGIRLSTHGLDRTPSVKYLHMAIKNVIVDGIDGKYDLIYSAGLFDYLSDPVAKMAAQTLTENLTTGGKLVIGNFTAVSGMRLGMDLILDWKLIYRSEVELRRLYSVENRAVTVESEPERVNLFVVIQ